MLYFEAFLNPGKRLKVDSSFGRGERLHGEQEVELELEQVADFLKVRTGAQIAESEKELSRQH